MFQWNFAYISFEIMASSQKIFISNTWFWSVLVEIMSEKEILDNLFHWMYIEALEEISQISFIILRFFTNMTFQIGKVIYAKNYSLRITQILVGLH